MNKYDPARIWYYEIYTYFGRVVFRVYIPRDKLHHAYEEQARLAMNDFERQTGNPHWVRLIK